MRVVIDTNVFVESISRTSPYHSLFTNLTKGNFLICISNSILLEYEEVLYSLHRQENADRLMDFLNVSPFVIPVSPNKYYNLIVADPDDNKFTDCAIAANADFIITSTPSEVDVLRERIATRMAQAIDHFYSPKDREEKQGQTPKISLGIGVVNPQDAPLKSPLDVKVAALNAQTFV